LSAPEGDDVREEVRAIFQTQI